MPKLTKRLVESTKPRMGKDINIMDSELKGFGIRIRSESRTYFIRYRSHGRQRRLVIGRHGELTLQQARLLAQKQLATIVEGADPAGDKAAARDKPNVMQLCERYMTEHALVKKKSRPASEDQRQIDSYILPKLGRLQVDAVSRTDIARLHNGMQDKPYQANRTLALLSKIFHMAELWGLREQRTNPTYGVTKFRETSRKRYLGTTELARLGQTLKESGEHPSVVAGIRLLLFTGCRLNEIRCLKWEHINRENAIIVLEDTKTGYRTIPLNSAALAVIDGLAPELGNHYVLPGKLPGQPWADLAKPWRRIREKAGLSDVRIHDLRHTAASFGVNLGMSLPVVGHLLGHKEAKTTSRYAHLALDPVREASEEIGKALQQAMEAGAPKVKVIPLDGKKSGQ